MSERGARCACTHFFPVWFNNNQSEKVPWNSPKVVQNIWAKIQVLLIEKIDNRGKNRTCYEIPALVMIVQGVEKFDSNFSSSQQKQNVVIQWYWLSADAGWAKGMDSFMLMILSVTTCSLGQNWFEIQHSHRTSWSIAVSYGRQMEAPHPEWNVRCQEQTPRRTVAFVFCVWVYWTEAGWSL